MNRKSFTERFNSEVGSMSQTQVNKNKLAKVINSKLIILNDKTLRDTIVKNLKENKLSLPKLKELDTKVDTIVLQYITDTNSKLYILNDKLLHNKIAKSLKDNLLTLKELKDLNTQLDLIIRYPSDSVSYYNNLYFMFKIRNPFSQHNIPMY